MMADQINAAAHQLIGTIITSDDDAMRSALVLARVAFDAGEVPVGAVVVQDNKIIGVGANSPINSLDPTCHAEVVAIRDAAKRLGNYRLNDTTLYVTVEPCSMCAGAIVHSRVKRLVYGTTEPKAGVASSAEQFFQKPFLNRIVLVDGGILADECSSIMTEFFALRRAGKKRLKEQLKTGD
jgi:tRNA(adenine34) deaminase